MFYSSMKDFNVITYDVKLYNRESKNYKKRGRQSIGSMNVFGSFMVNSCRELRVVIIGKWWVRGPFKKSC